MFDELEQPGATPDSEAAAASAAEELQQAEQQHDDDLDPDSQEHAEEEEEVEIGDKKFALPKSAAEKLKAERLMQADYTRKTQEVAETRKSVEAEREQVRQHAEQQQQYIKEIAKVTALDDQIAEYAKLDWNALSDQDPISAQKLHFQYQALQQQRQTAAEAITQKQQQNALVEQQEVAKQIQEAEAYVQREIKGWTPERSTQLNSYAQAEGVKFDQAFAKVLVQNPALIKIMHKAAMFDQLEKKQSTKPAPTPAPAPVTRVGAARATAAKDPSKMTDAEWAKWRSEKNRKR
jgi:tetrahydromethanopterin S-methyltransferase subunit B